MKAEDLAKIFHDAYEKVAVKHGWNTQESTKVEFDKLPEANKKTMIETCEIVLIHLQAQLKEKEQENKKLREEKESMELLLQEIYQSETARWWMKYKINEQYPELIQLLTTPEGEEDILKCCICTAPISSDRKAGQAYGKYYCDRHIHKMPPPNQQER